MHTPETLQAMPAPRNANRGTPPAMTLYGPDPIGAAGAVPLADVFNADTAARLVACWNACAGIDTGDLRRMGVGALDDARDRLIDIARTLADHPEVKTGNAKVHYAYCMAKRDNAR